MEKGKYNILIFKLYYIIQGVKMYLSEETMKNLSKIIGVPSEELRKMDEDEIKEYVEGKIGRKLKWPEGAKVEGLPIRTMESAEKAMGAENRDEEEEER